MKSIFATMLVAAGAMAIKLSEGGMGPMDLSDKEIEAGMKEHGIDLGDIKSFCEGVKAEGPDADSDEVEACRMAKKRAGRRGMDLAQLDSGDESEIRRQMKKNDVDLDDVKAFCDGVKAEGKDANPEDRKMCGKARKAAKEAMSLAQLDSGDESEIRRRMEDNDVDLDDIKRKCDAVKAQGPDADPEDRKWCKRARKAAKEAMDLAQLDSGDESEIRRQMKKNDVDLDDVKAFCDGVKAAGPDADPTDREMCGKARKAAKEAMSLAQEKSDLNGLADVDISDADLSEIEDFVEKLDCSDSENEEICGEIKAAKRELREALGELSGEGKKGPKGERSGSDSGSGSGSDSGSESEGPKGPKGKKAEKKVKKAKKDLKKAKKDQKEAKSE